MQSEFEQFLTGLQTESPFNYSGPPLGMLSTNFWPIETPLNPQGGQMCNIFPFSKFRSLIILFPLQESSQRRLCRRVAGHYARFVQWFKSGPRRSPGYQADGVSTVLVNFKRHLYSPCSFQPGTVGPARDRFPNRCWSAYRRTSGLSFSDTL